ARPPRVLVVGDSYAFGFGVEAEECFAKVAERELRKRFGPDLEVVNAGVNAYGTLEEVEMLKRMGPRFHPAVIVLAFFEGNDVRNAEDFGEKRTMGPDGYLTRPGQDPNVVPLSYLAAYSAMKWRNIGEKLATRRSIEVCQKALREAKE